MPQASRRSPVSTLCLRSMSTVSPSIVIVRLPLPVLVSFNLNPALVCSGAALNADGGDVEIDVFPTERQKFAASHAST